VTTRCILSVSSDNSPSGAHWIDSSLNMNRPRKVTYRAGLFEFDNLSTPGKLDAALHEFAGVINQANYVEALKGLFDKNYLLELVLSGISCIA